MTQEQELGGVYYVIREKKTKRWLVKYGQSAAPHLYLSQGKAESRRKQLWSADQYETAPVQLTELKGEES